MNRPSISVIVPYYNSIAYIGRLVASIRAQSHTDFECILVDDGSSDGTEQKLLPMVEGDGRFICTRRPASHLPGGRGAKNHGYGLSRGSYIVFFDADDVMQPHHLESRYAYLESHPEKDGVVSNFGWRVLEGRPRRIYSYNPDIFKEFKRNVREDWFWLNYMDLRFWFNPGNPMWRRGSIDGRPLWDETTSIGEDHEYHARLMLDGLDMGFIEDATWDYMANPESMISTSEAVGPLLSRSYGKMLVVGHIQRHLGERRRLFRKELTWQVKIMRRIMAAKGTADEKLTALNTMLSRIDSIMEMLGYGPTRRRLQLHSLGWISRLHLKTGRAHSLYTWLVRDRFPTEEYAYFKIA